MNRLYTILLLLFIPYTTAVWAQDLSTLNYGIRSEIQTNTIYDLHFSTDSLLYIATDKGLWRYNGIQFQEIPKLDGSSIDGSYLKEDLTGQLYMQSFKGQLYQIINDSLHKYQPPKEIATEIIATYLGKNFIYYIHTDKIFVYDLNGEKKTTLSYPNGSFDKSVNTHGFLGTTIVLRGDSKRVATTQLKDSKLQVFEDDWDFTFNPNFEEKRLLRNIDQQIIYASDSSLYLDLSLSPQKITPRFVRRIANHLLVGCTEGLYFPKEKRLVFKGKDITDILEDSEGNIWIATLNKGLHKLASFNNLYYPIENEEKAVHIIHKRKDSLIYADIGSNLYYYNGKDFECFFESPHKVYPKNFYFDYVDNTYVLSGTFIKFFNATFEPLAFNNAYGELLQDQEGYALKKYRTPGNLVYAPLKYFHNLIHYQNATVYPDTIYQGPYYSKYLYKRKITDVIFNKSFKSEETYKWKDQLLYYVNDSLYFDQLEPPSTNYKIAIPGQFQKVSVINDRVYVQTSTDFMEFNLNAKLVNSIPREQGLEETIKFLSADDQYLAITTANAVHILEVSTLKPIYKFTTQNGIKSIDFNKAWVYENALYVNGSEGLTEILLDKHNFNTGSPSLKLKGIYIDGKEMSKRQFSYQQNNLKIELSIRSFTAAGQLYWRLNGKEWRVLEGRPQILLDDLRYGNYKLEAYWLNELGGKSPVLQYHFVIHKPFWLQLWFILMIIGVVSGIIYGLYRRRMLQVKKRNDLENGLIASQMTALKSQMNPHFIFNALNSIQSLIIHRQNEEAYDYVDKFSVLLRQILNFSDQDFIPLYQEIEMLHNYLDMEKMRFDGNLEIHLEVI